MGVLMLQLRIQMFSADLSLGDSRLILIYNNDATARTTSRIEDECVMYEEITDLLISRNLHAHQFVKICKPSVIYDRCLPSPSRVSSSELSSIKQEQSSIAGTP